MAIAERALAWLRRKYVTEADERQEAMGLEYVTAETTDLAKEIERFVAKEKRLDDEDVKVLVLDGTVDDIARLIESHDLFECPSGSTYHRAARAIADDIVARYAKMEKADA